MQTPEKHSEKTTETWKNSFLEAAQTLQQFAGDPLQLEKCRKFSQMLVDLYKAGGNLFTCGNGGSHCDAMHFAEEMTGRYRKDRRPLGAMVLGDAAHTTCVANDYGFDHVFSRQVEGLARAGDLLVGLSTSGNSKNVLEAVGFETIEKYLETAAKCANDAHLGNGKFLLIKDSKVPGPLKEVHQKICELVDGRGGARIVARQQHAHVAADARYTQQAGVMV